MIAIGRRLRAVAAGLAIVLAIAVVYGQSLRFDFLWDDHLQIQQNPWLRSPEGLGRIFTRPSWSFQQELEPQRTNYYRPLFLSTYALIARTWGIAPRPYHAVSLLLHALVSGLVAWLVTRQSGSQGAGLLAGLLFALHPAQAEAVAWPAAQGDLVCAACALLALLAESGAGPRWPLVFAGTLGACLAKETGVGLVLVLAVGAWLRVRARPRAPLAWLSLMAPALFALALYACLRWHALGSLVPVRHAAAASLIERAQLACALFARHVLLLLCPFALGPQLFVHVEAPGALVVLLGAGLGLAALLLVLRGRPASVALGIATTVAFLLPTLDANAVGRINFAERYAYLPLIGLACLAGWWLGRLPACTFRPAAAVAGIVLVACGLVTYGKLPRYADDAHYFDLAARVAAQDPAARNGLGIVLANAGDSAGAEREYRMALQLDPSLAVAWTNLGGLLERRGDLAGALAAWQRALTLDDRNAIAGVRLARLHRSAGNARAAADVLDDFLRRGLGAYDVLVERALLWLDAGRPTEAEALLQRALLAQPESPRAFYLLAQALYAQDRQGDAERAAAAAIERGAGPGPRRLMALMRARAGDRPAAQRWIDEAERMAPNDAETAELRKRLGY